AKTRAWTTPPSSRSRRRATRTSPTSSGTATTRRKREAGFSRLSRQGFSWSGRGRLVTIHFKLLKLRTRSSRHRVLRGAIAQLGERLNGIQEVRGSTPLGSTKTSSRQLPPPFAEYLETPLLQRFLAFLTPAGYCLLPPRCHSAGGVN